MIVRRSNRTNRRLGTKPRSEEQQLMETRMRRDPRKRHSRKKTNMLLTKILLALALSLAAYLGGRSLLEKFFFKNPDYNLQHLEVSLDSLMSLEELKSMTGLHEGRNIFSIDISSLEKTLSALPEVKRAHVQRLLPNTIEILLERRVPIFRLASSEQEPFLLNESMVIDQEGMVMRPKKLPSSSIELPLLLGIPIKELVVGKPLEDEKFSFALDLWNLLMNSKNAQLLNIRALDLSSEYSALAIDETGARYTFGKERIPAQVERLQKLLLHSQQSGREIETANLILEYNTPVTFRPSAPSSSAQTASLGGVAKKVHHP